MQPGETRAEVEQGLLVDEAEVAARVAGLLHVDGVAASSRAGIR